MSPLQALAPDQRAVLELLLRQGRSYGELSDLLAIPEDAVRARAQAALENLAPDHAAPAGEAGRITDWLLGQLDGPEASETEATIAGSAAARQWASAVAERLREVDPERVPAVPTATPADSPAPTSADSPAPTSANSPPATRTDPPAPRPRPVRDGAAAPAPAPRPRPTATPAQDGAGTASPRSSRLGGAILIGVLALVIGGFLAWFLTRDDDDDPATAGSAATQTATPTPTPQVVNEVPLRAAGGSGAQGLLRVFKREEDGRLVFALAADKVPPNEGREVYAVWFTKQGGGARRLGFAQAQVGEEGVLTTGGPQPGDEPKLARWLVDYDTVVVTREREADARRPGPAILRGTLPGGSD